MNKKSKIKCLILACLAVMTIVSLYGCGTNGSTEKPADAETTSKADATLKETELPSETETVEDTTSTTSQTEESKDKIVENDEPTSTVAETEESLAVEPESQNEVQPSAQQAKSLCGTYELPFGEDGGAELEITYSSEEDMYIAFFSGSLGFDAGSTEGFLSAYTDGTDNIWEYYDNSEFEAGNYASSLRLEYDGADLIVVTSLDGQTFGGMQFPGFSGEYTRTAEYPMP